MSEEEKKIPPNFIKTEKRVYVPKPGFIWNPHRTFPRNEKCICGSGNKFKKCCLNKLPPCVVDVRKTA